MSDLQQAVGAGEVPNSKDWRDSQSDEQGKGVVHSEDWWAVGIGLVLILIAYGLFASGSSIKWLTVAPVRWDSLSSALSDVGAHITSYLALLVLFAVVFGVAFTALKQTASRFVPAFIVLFVVTTAILVFGAWSTSLHYNLEPPLVALALGLVVSNTVGVPQWLRPALRVEFYVKLGIVLLGATLPLTLLSWAGPVVLTQATIVSLATFFVIFWVARWFGVEKRFAAVLGVGGAVCGVSAAIAVGGALRTKREQPAVAISLVVLWAIVMVFALPFISRALGLPTGVAGAWIGTSEFADAAGIAAAQAYSDFAAHAGAVISGTPDAAVQAFTLMKVLGRDIWIGIWAFVLALLATTRWDRQERAASAAGSVPSEGTPVQTSSLGREVWQRFPKFVIGFVIASALVTWLASHYSLADYRRVVTPQFIAPITALRVWAFTFCFLSIGLSTRLSTLKATGIKPFLAFTAGVIVNVLLGYWLSTHVFVNHWIALGS